MQSHLLWPESVLLCPSTRRGEGWKSVRDMEWELDRISEVEDLLKVEWISVEDLLKVEWISVEEDCGVPAGVTFLCATISMLVGTPSITLQASRLVIPTRQLSPTITIWSPFRNFPQSCAGDFGMRVRIKMYCSGVSMPPSMMTPRGVFLPVRSSCMERGARRHSVT